MAKLNIFSTGTIATDNLGNGSFTANQGSQHINGHISSIIIDLTTVSSPAIGCRVKVTDATYGIVILDEPNIQSTSQFYPRSTARTNNGNNLVYTGTSGVVVYTDVIGKVNVTVTNGGNTKNLKVIIYYE